MPRKTTKKDSLLNINWQESYGSIILGAIIVIIFGLLVANFIVKRNQQINDGVKTEEVTEQEQNNKLSEHTIQAGDSLSKISDKYYGSMDYWPAIARANNIANPNVIYVDSRINIPAKEEIVKIKDDMNANSYQVQAGDTLFTISEKMYGNGADWQRIAKANGVGKLANGNPLIFAGSVLMIPR